MCCCTNIMQLSCRHFDYSREGGRASQRATDFVRRRLWRKKPGPSDLPATEQGKLCATTETGHQTASVATDMLISPTTVMAGARCVDCPACVSWPCVWLLHMMTAFTASYALLLQSTETNRDGAEKECSAYLHRHVCWLHQAPPNLECRTMGPGCMVGSCRLTADLL